MSKSLWKQSLVWKWTFILTILLTCIAIFASPWTAPHPSGVQKAQYNPPASQKAASTAGLKLPAGYSPPSGSNIVSRQASTAPSPLSTKTVSQPHRDTRFNIAIPRPVEVFSPGTELHVIGVYGGAPPDGEKKRPWWANCETKDGKIVNPEECHKKHASSHVAYEITINMSYNAPLVLALMSYEPVVWNIKGKARSQLQKIILSGYYSQDIKGVDDNIPVDVYTYESSSCQNCRKQSGHFYAYKSEGKEYLNAVNKLKSITGLSPSSFQGNYKANTFSLTRSIAGRHHKQKKGVAYREPISGKKHNDHIIIANTNLSLPAGDWQTVAYRKISDKAKENTLISLAQTADGVLKSLYTTRIEQTGKSTGFASNLSCQNKDNYLEQSVSNSANGNQLCYWIEELTSPWQQPFFDLTAEKLKAMGIDIPTDVINVGFHKADMNKAITTYVYNNPETEAIYTQPSSWHASPWNKSHIHNYPRRKAFMDHLQGWAETWFQFFRLQ